MMEARKTPPAWTRIGSIERDGLRLSIVRTEYNDGHIALFITRHDGQLCSRLSTHIPGAALEDDEFFARTQNENADIRVPLLATGIFVDTGRRVVGPADPELEVWRLNRMTPVGLTATERGELARWLKGRTQE